MEPLFTAIGLMLVATVPPAILYFIGRLCKPNPDAIANRAERKYRNRYRRKHNLPYGAEVPERTRKR